MFNKIDKYTKLFRKEYSKEKNIENSLMSIKKYGANQMESVRVIMLELSLSLKEADNVVIKSKTWSDEKINLIKLRKSFEKSIENLDKSSN